ncbi:hypothetical protein GGS24DRAFT_312145 [Hypoxylon argillaceum]|nr:hypothetical protein GGS24DRAFT_312145 [Hypoxylon argillaceum]
MDYQTLSNLVDAERSRTQLLKTRLDLNSSPEAQKILERLNSLFTELESVTYGPTIGLSTRDILRVVARPVLKRKLEHNLPICKQLNDTLMSFLVAQMEEQMAQMDKNIHNLMPNFKIFNVGLQKRGIRVFRLQSRSDEMTTALKPEIRTHEMRLAPPEKSANAGALREPQDYDDDNNNLSLMALGDDDSDQPRIQNFHHLCLGGLGILAQIFLHEGFRTSGVQLQTWSFGLMGETDGLSDDMSLDGMFRPGNGSLWPSDVYSMTAGYSMIVDRLLKILLYIESLLIIAEPDSSDVVSYLNRLQDFFETSTVAKMLQEFSMQDLDEVKSISDVDEVKSISDVDEANSIPDIDEANSIPDLDEAQTILSKVMVCVSGIEDQVQRLYDILPAIGSTRQMYCFGGVSKLLGHVTTSSPRELASQKAKRYEDKSEPPDLIEFNTQLSEAIVASLRTKEEEDIKREANLFEKINDRLRSWKATREGDMTAKMIEILNEMKEPLQKVHDHLKKGSEDSISAPLVSGARSKFEHFMDELSRQRVVIS